MDNKSNAELVERAKQLKQKEKIKLFDIIIDAFENNDDISQKLQEALYWSDKLFD